MEDIFDIFEEILTDDEEDYMELIEMPRAPKVFRPRMNHLDRWNDEEFLDRFRISKGSTELLLQEIEPVISHPTNRNEAISAMLQLLITLRFFASGCMLISVGDFAGVHKCTVSRIVARVSVAIASLAPRYIYLPRNEAKLRQTKLEFYNIARFPKVIGAIDCTHVKIQSPGGNDVEMSRNRKGFFSLNVQTVADSTLRIRNIVARWPGSSHDSTIFNNSRLRARFEQGLYLNCFLVGDCGYALKPYLMTPVRNPVTRPESLYNESQIRTRNVVERSYGVWKRRFPILSLGVRVNLETVQAIIVATAVLHNIAINRQDGMPEGDELNEENQNELDIQPHPRGYAVRDQLINEYFTNL